jgi:hypothetical protein
MAPGTKYLKRDCADRIQASVLQPAGWEQFWSGSHSAGAHFGDDHSLSLAATAIAEGADLERLVACAVPREGLEPA